jgi:undecaprenyl pyrophosphate synthase
LILRLRVIRGYPFQDFLTTLVTISVVLLLFKVSQQRVSEFEISQVVYTALLMIVHLYWPDPSHVEFLYLDVVVVVAVFLSEM